MNNDKALTVSDFDDTYTVQIGKGKTVWTIGERSRYGLRLDSQNGRKTTFRTIRTADLGTLTKLGVFAPAAPATDEVAPSEPAARKAAARANAAELAQADRADRAALPDHAAVLAAEDAAYFAKVDANRTRLEASWPAAMRITNPEESARIAAEQAAGDAEQERIATQETFTPEPTMADHLAHNARKLAVADAARARELSLTGDISETPEGRAAAKGYVYPSRELATEACAMLTRVEGIRYTFTGVEGGYRVVTQDEDDEIMDARSDARRAAADGARFTAGLRAAIAETAARLDDLRSVSDAKMYAEAATARGESAATYEDRLTPAIVAHAEGAIRKAAVAKAADNWYSLSLVFDTLGNPVAMFEREHDAAAYAEQHPGYTAGTVK